MNSIYVNNHLIIVIKFVIYLKTYKIANLKITLIKNINKEVLMLNHFIQIVFIT